MSSLKLFFFQDEIRKELKDMPFEDLIKLKQKLGTKVYNSTVLGVKKTAKKAVPGEKSFKRENKNRPREMSSKTPIPLIPQRKKKAVNAAAAAAAVHRDPRFDPNCGDFDRDEFKERFSFVNEMKVQEAAQLKDDLKTVQDPEERARIKLLAQRLENQAREETQRKEAKQRQSFVKKQNQEERNEGKTVIFESKKKRKVENLVQKFRELKETGKLQKHIEKRRKKKMGKDRKKLTLMDE